MKELSPEALRTSLLQFSSVNESYINNFANPLMEKYAMREFEQHVDLGDDYIASLDVDPLTAKDIEEIYIHKAVTQLLLTGNLIISELNKRQPLENSILEHYKTAYMYFSTTAILEVAKQRQRSPINFASLYRVTQSMFNEKFGNLLNNLNKEERRDIFNTASRMASSMINKHGFTVIGEVE